MVVVLLVYATAKALDFGRRGVLPRMFDGSLEATLLWTELGLLVVLPMILLGIPKLAANPVWLFAGAMSAVLGFVVNRLNVSITGLEATVRAGYVPAVMELLITAGLIALGVWAFALAVRYLPVFAEQPDQAKEARGTPPPEQAPATIVVTCGCSKRFRVGVEYAGKRGKCPACGRPLAVPAPAVPN
jgi:Ni/Fe-hydrogenase subunit HybB-like protein